MTRRRLLEGVLCAALCLVGAVARGAPLTDTANVSYSTWTVSGSSSGPSVLLKFLLPEALAQSLTATGLPVLTTRKLGEFVLRHVAVGAAGRNCPAVDQGYDIGIVDPLAVGPALHGFEILFRCPVSGALTLHDHALFDRFAGHVNFARIVKDGRVVEQLFTAAHQELRLPAAGSVPAAGFGQYLRLGVMHLFRSPAPLCFLVGSLLLLRRRREVLWLAGAVVVGYGISLAVSTRSWILPRVPLLEAYMGFLVALLAAMITLRELRQPRVSMLGCPALLAVLAILTAFTSHHLQMLVLAGAAMLAASLLVANLWFESRRELWLVPVVLVGFLDGFALPAALEPLQLPQRSQAWMVAAFDCGAALAAVASMVLLLAALSVLRGRLRTALRRLPASELAAAGLGGLGTFWLLSRLYN